MINRQRWKVIGILIGAILLSACQTTRYLPSEQNINQLSQGGFPAQLILKDGKITNDIGPVFGGSIVGEAQQSIKNGVVSWSSPIEGSPLLFASVDVSSNSKESSTNWASFILYLVTLTLIPATEIQAFDINVELSTPEGEAIYAHTVTEKVKSYLSVYFPTPLFVGSMGGKPYIQALNAGLHRQERQLFSWADDQHSAFIAATNGKDIYDKRAWLRENPSSLFRLQLIEEFAQASPGNKPIDWHKENLEYFAGYSKYLPAEYQIWFIGPEGRQVLDIVEAVNNGEDQAILAARIESNGPYKQFDSDEVAKLKELGLSTEVIVAMMRSGTAPAAAPIARRASVATKSSGIASVLILNNSGAYMNPWTNDDVLADWVDKAINAKIGSATGSVVGAAAGAYAANKVLESVPFGSFFGGMIGSSIGKSTGRNMAIEASGGMEYIRQSSDQSFRTLADMAAYLKSTYSSNGNYADAINAADIIYPGLKEAINAAY
jgi:hypothetical protein